MVLDRMKVPIDFMQKEADRREALKNCLCANCHRLSHQYRWQSRMPIVLFFMTMIVLITSMVSLIVYNTLPITLTILALSALIAIPILFALAGRTQRRLQMVIITARNYGVCTDEN